MNKISLTIILSLVLVIPQEIFAQIKVKRDKKQKILGLCVSNGRVRNLWFEKQ